LVERNSSAVIFSSSRTLTFAAKIVKTAFDEFASKRLGDSLGATGTGVGVLCAVEDAPYPSESGEKNPLTLCDEDLRISVLDVTECFSEPTLYTNSTTSALI
jgi:hypothetical protein